MRKSKRRRRRSFISQISETLHSENKLYSDTIGDYEITVRKVVEAMEEIPDTFLEFLGETYYTNTEDDKADEDILIIKAWLHFLLEEDKEYSSL
jgi:hypothetical protein